MDERVAALLQKMTLEEQIGQMCIYDPRLVGDDFLKKYHVGAILHQTGEKATNYQRELRQAHRLHIPLLCGIDAIHGHGLHAGATIFPTPLALASTFDEDLIKRVGLCTAREVLATGVHWTFSPVCCIARDVRFGRCGEMFGEDPYLSSVLCRAMVRGYKDGNVLTTAKHFAGYSEGQGGRDTAESDLSERKLRTYVFPSFKASLDAGVDTFMTAYQVNEGLPCTANPWLLTEVLRNEWHFDGFVVSDWNTLRDMVTKQCVAASFEAAAIKGLMAGTDMFMCTPEFPEAMLRAVQGAKEVDGDAHEGPSHAVLQTNPSRTVLTAAIGRACARVLAVKLRAGLFDDGVTEIAVQPTQTDSEPSPTEPSPKLPVEPIPPESHVVPATAPKEHVGDIPLADTDEETTQSLSRRFATHHHRTVALEAAEASVVLLKNANDILPLDPHALKRVAVVGPCADSMSSLLGDWTSPCSGGAHPRGLGVTVLDAFRSNPDIEVFHEPGCDAMPWDTLDEDEDDGGWMGLWNRNIPQAVSNAVKAAKRSDVAVVVLGDPRFGEGHDAAILDLPHEQERLLRAVYSTKTPVIVIILASKPLTIRWAVDHVHAILMGWNPGALGGQALYNIIMGVTCPSGKSTMTWPHTAGQHPCYYNQLPGWHASHYESLPQAPLFAFGFGLSYTQFAYTDLTLESHCLSKGQPLELTVTLANWGGRDGVEIVQCYTHAKVSSVTVPVKTLSAFARVALDANESCDVKLEVPYESLGLWTAACERVVEPGDYEVWVGGSSRPQDLRQSAVFSVKA